MSTYSHLLLPPSAEGLRDCANIIKEGGLVAFPTETVYGLGANALDAHAVRSIFTAKGRPLTDPLIVHVANKQEAKKLLSMFDDRLGCLDQATETSDEQIIFNLLADRFWPGPLTLIAKASDVIPRAVTADTGFVGVRVPAHALALQLLEACGVPIAAPSANRFAHVSPTRAHHVLADLGCKGVRVLDGDHASDESGGSREQEDTCRHGIESTVLRINETTHTLELFRQGAITKDDIEAVLSGCALPWKVEVVNRVVKMHAHRPEESIDATITTAAVGDKDKVSGESGNVEGEIAPGQAVTHYSPDIPCYIVSACTFDESSDSAEPPVFDLDTQTSLPLIAHGTRVLTSLPSLSSRGVVLIDFNSQLRFLQKHVHAYIDLSPTGNSVEGAHNLFAHLRWAETVPGAACVWVCKLVLDKNDANTDIISDSSASHPPFESRDDKLMFGLTDRMFRAASGVEIAVQLKR